MGYTDKQRLNFFFDESRPESIQLYEDALYWPTWDCAREKIDAAMRDAGLAEECPKDAAPALLEALEMLMDVQNGPPLIAWTNDWNEAMERARAAIAAAKGGDA